MRIVLQGYAIYGAVVCTILTGALAFNLSDNAIESTARAIINLSYLIFGPLLLTFVNYGFAHFKQLAFVCSPRGITHHVNFVDILVVLTAFILSLCVTFTMAM